MGQTGDGLGDVPSKDPNIDEVYSVRAGKFRRYHGEGLKQLLDIPTVLKNARDLVWVVTGLIQSWRLLGTLKPDCLFVKGGFVGVPVGLAAAARGIPFITHDSDALPGLANRIIARWAAVHAVALPKEVYHYPANKTVTVGVPVHANYQLVTVAGQERYRRDIGLGKYKRMILVTGGGLGAQRLNEAVGAILPELLRDYDDLVVVQGAGRMHETATRELYARTLSPAELERVQVYGYLTDLYRYSGAADVIITRAGATTLAEFAVQRRACVVVPNPVLTGGHQVKNAAYLAQRQAIEVVTEVELAKDVRSLERAVRKLLDDRSLRQELGAHLAALAKPNAARQLADLLLEQIAKTTRS